MLFTRTANSQLNKKDYKSQYLKAVQLYKKGKFENAEKNLLSILENKKKIDTINLIVLDNMLGIIYYDLGKYNKALKKYNNLLSYIKKGNLQKYSKVLNNIGNIYRMQGRFQKAEYFYMEAINIIINSNLSNNSKSFLLIEKYFNFGLLFFQEGNYKEAIKYYNKSLLIKKQYNLKGIDKIYFNLARCYKELNKFEKADTYFTEAIELSEKEFGANYYQSARLHMFYGDFLREQKQFKKANIHLLKALDIYKQTYGETHPYTANSYLYLGKYYSAISKHDSALCFFQQSLIANSEGFNSDDVNDNPNLHDCFSGLQLLRSLKMKAKALQAVANSSSTNTQTKFLNLSVKTVDIALNLVSILRKDYIYLGSKLIITEEEKECYSISVKAAMHLFNISGDRKYAEMAFRYASASKASVMSDNLEEEREINTLVPVSVRNEKLEREQKISAYKKLIYEENEKLKQDIAKIDLWKSKLFTLNNDYGVFIEEMKAKYHISEDCKKNSVSIKDIQNQLPNETTLVEYFITKDADSEKHVLYIFIINSKAFKQLNFELTNSFKNNVLVFKNSMNQNDSIKLDVNLYNRFNRASYGLYKELIEPIKPLLKGQNVIIVPDEELAYISFEALISDYKEYSNINYANLPFLIYDYCFSYAYSTHLLMKNHTENYSDFVYAFAPDYDKDKTNLFRHKFGDLANTKNEINSVLNQFEGEAFIGNVAIADSFKSIAEKGGILHLAMHAFSENNDKDFSFLAFSKNANKSTNDKGLLYSYEIDKMKIKSPMVVLSACNTGNGKLYSGEGVMSLSRSFIKTGVPAVVHSLWNVNDDAGFKIMQFFYENLAENMSKNNALRKAKLQYLQTSTPSMLNPAFWSGYVLSGDVSPIKKANYMLYYLIGLGLLLIIVFGFVLRKRRH